MALKTGRADAVAHVMIDYKRCIDCGLCVAVCKGAPLFLDDTGKWGSINLMSSVVLAAVIASQCAPRIVSQSKGEICSQKILLPCRPRHPVQRMLN